MSTPPRAKRVEHVREHHGDRVVDPYEWLRDKDDPEVIAHLEAENAWADERTAHLEPLRSAIFEEIRSRTQETDLSVPVRIRDHWYYGRTVEGKQYGLSCRRPVEGPDDWVPPWSTSNAPSEKNSWPSASRLPSSSTCSPSGVTPGSGIGRPCPGTTRTRHCAGYCRPSNVRE